MKIGLIGCGVMGQNHLRVLKNLTEVAEITVSDPSENNLNTAKKNYGIEKCYSNYNEMIKNEALDGIVIATPPVTHRNIAIDVLEAKIPTLLEKPIAHTLKDANDIIEASKKNNTLLTVGHIERFNPVISQLKTFLNNNVLKNIYLINTHRIGPFPKRLLGNVEGVLVDLAIHDFDIIYYLSSKIKSIKSQVIKENNQEIYAKTLMELESGVKASSEFSWVSPRYLRTIEIYGDAGMLMGDYYNQEVTFYENSDFENAESKNSSFLGEGLITVGRIIKYPIRKQEPLALELKNFLNAIKGKEEILVKPEEAFMALEATLSI